MFVTSRFLFHLSFFSHFKQFFLIIFSMYKFTYKHLKNDNKYVWKQDVF